MPDARTKQELLWKRWGSLTLERESWLDHWQELARYFAPRSGTFIDPAGSETNFSNAGATRSTNRGTKRHQHIYDNSALRAVDVFVSGMMAGMSSPARPWFRLKTPDEDLNERHAVRDWLHTVEQLLRDVFAQSNTYRSFRRIYEELGVFGTGASLVLPDFQDGLRHYALTAGEYAIDTDSRDVVNTLYRLFEMNVGQLVHRFGLENCSQRVQDLHKKGDLHHWIAVLHVIEPRRERDPLKMDNKNMPWASVYFEPGAKEDKYLRESGFRRFPALSPRWKINGHDIYGESPAMRALGDVKQLQQEQYRKAQAIDYQTQPPLQVPTNLIEAVAKGPGGLTVVPSTGEGIKSAWEVDLNLEYLLNDIFDVRRRVSEAMFEDMFMLFTSTRRGVQPPTAEEIVAQQEEKLLLIGPALENVHTEMLGPAVEDGFAILLEGGLIPPAPPELEGQPLTIQFVSTLAQAQRMIGLSNLDRMVGTIVNLASIAPSAVDKLNTDKLVDTYSDALGVDPDLIVADDQVALIRQQRAQAQQQAKLTAALPEAAKTAKALGESSPEGVSAATQLLQQ